MAAIRPRHLLFSRDYPPLTGGVANFLTHRVGHREGIDLSVFTVEAEGWQQFDGESPVETRRYRPLLAERRILNRLFQFWQGWFGLRKARKTCRFDVLESGTALPGSFYGWALKKLSPLKTITFVHGNDFLRAQKFFASAWMLRKGLESTDLIVANSNFTADLVRNAGLDRGQIVVINPPVDPERFRPGIDCSFVRERHGLAGKEVLMTVSRLYGGRKGFDTIFASLRRLREAGRDTVLLVAGSGPARQLLEEKAREMGVGEAVIFAGYVDDAELPAYYCAADIFVMVSDYDRAGGDVEGYGIVYDEAHGCETPCIAADAGGAPEAVRHGQDGIIVPPGDSSALAEALKSLLARPEYARELGRNGRRRLLTKDYAWEELNQLKYNSKTVL